MRYYGRTSQLPTIGVECKDREGANVSYRMDLHKLLRVLSSTTMPPRIPLAVVKL